MNEVYTGKNDLDLDMPNRAFDLSLQSQLKLGREFSFKVANTHATASREIVIFKNRKSTVANLIADGAIVYTGGATDLVCTPKDGLVADWLYDLEKNPQVVLMVDVSATNATQLDERFKVSRWDFYNQQPTNNYLTLNRPELRNQQDSKKITIPFNNLASTEDTELSIIIPALCTTTFRFMLGAAMRDSYTFQQKLLLAQAGGAI